MNKLIILIILAFASSSAMADGSQNNKDNQNNKDTNNTLTVAFIQPCESNSRFEENYSCNGRPLFVEIKTH